MTEYLCWQDRDNVTKSRRPSKAIVDGLAHDQSRILTSPDPSAASGYTFYEFFAGCGMARAGLGQGWDCLFANDFDEMKGRVYQANWDGGKELLVEDINKIRSSDLPDRPDLVWASFPCQDLSLAGNYTGIGHSENTTQTRSATFWPFWKLLRELMAEGRSPSLIVLENVYGVLTSNQGRDFASIGDAIAKTGYRFGAMVIDARYFVPHSRPRVFIVAFGPEVCLPENLISNRPVEPWHPTRMIVARDGLSPETKNCWVWWNLPVPKARSTNFIDLIEDEPTGVKWNSEAETEKLLSMMSDVNQEKLRLAKQSGRRVVGGVYKRTRFNDNGRKVQRAEVRFDDVAGCLRTPAGGSSKQSILLVDGQNVRSRLLSPREAARLMGLPDSFILPKNSTAAYQITGDGVAVPVVRHLARHILEPILRHSRGTLFSPEGVKDLTLEMA